MFSLFALIFLLLSLVCGWDFALAAGENVRTAAVVVMCGKTSPRSKLAQFKRVVTDPPSSFDRVPQGYCCLIGIYQQHCGVLGGCGRRTKILSILTTSAQNDRTRLDAEQNLRVTILYHAMMRWVSEQTRINESSRITQIITTSRNDRPAAIRRT